MRISLSRYRQIRIWIAIIIAVICSQSIIFENYFFPIVSIIIWILVLFFVRSKVKEIIADERDYALWGKAAMYALQIFSLCATIFVFILYALKKTNPSYEAIAITLAVAVCLLMVLYSCIFTFLNRDRAFDKRTIIMGIVLLIAVVAALRVLSGEDDRICDNWVRVKHGNPDFPQPTATCGKVSSGQSFTH